MDIAALSVSMADTKLMQGVGISMMKQAIEMTEQTGEQLTEMMDSVSESLIDIKV